MSDDELITSLGRLNPVRMEDVVGSVDSPAAAVLLESIVLVPNSPSRRRRPVSRRSRVPEALGVDQLEALGAANPFPIPAIAAFTGPEEAERRAAILDSIIAGTGDGARVGILRPYRGRLRRPTLSITRILRRRPTLDDSPPERTPGRVVQRTRRAIVLPIFAATVLAVSATAVVIVREHATRPASTACYGSDNYGSGSDSTIVTGSDSIAACQSQWFHGAFGAPRVPELIACILPSGFVGVFPGRSIQVCAKLNLSVALPPNAHTRAIASLHVQLDHDLWTATCVDLASAEKIIKNSLAKFGLAGWHILVSRHASRDLPCSTTVIIPPNSVSIVFVPRATTPTRSPN